MERSLAYMKLELVTASFSSFFKIQQERFEEGKTLKTFQKGKLETERVVKRGTEMFLFRNIWTFTIYLETCIKNHSIFFRKINFTIAFSFTKNAIFCTISCFTFSHDTLKGSGLMKNLQTRATYFQKGVLKETKKENPN